MMKISSCYSKEEWDAFLIENKGSFLQSTIWRDFKKHYQKVHQVEAREDNHIQGACQFFEEKSIFGKYFYIPYGPVAKNKEAEKLLLEEIIIRAKKEKAYFIKIEPTSAISTGLPGFFRIQPQKTIVSNIGENKEESLKDFSRTARYNIRYAQKRGVRVEKSDRIDLFIKLINKTTERQNFYTYSEEYFKRLLEIDNCDLFFALHDNRPIAGAILFSFGKTMHLLHAGSDHNKRNLKGPGLIRYETIEFAKNKKCEYYDFWGIDEIRFPGVTEYKRSFGGKEVAYPEGVDIPIYKLKYLFHKTAHKIKKRG